MMGGTLIQYTGAVPSNIPKRTFNNEILKPSYKSTGDFFFEKFLPSRFTVKGGRLLGYKKRDGEDYEEGKGFARSRGRSYTARKRKIHGHARPLVWSGESEQIATKVRDIRATSKGVRIVNHARTLNRTNYRAKRSDGPIRMSQEVTEIDTATEGERLTKFLQARVNENLREYKRITRVQV